MKHSKSALFLMELIIAILFFALASTVCIRLFSKAYLLSKQTVNENHAVMHAQNLAECFLATEGNLVKMKEFFPDATIDITTSDTNQSTYTLTLVFDDKWSLCDISNASYSATLVSHPETDGLLSADISIAPYNSSLEDTIYTLTITHHIPERRGNFAY